MNSSGVLETASIINHHKLTRKKRIEVRGQTSKCARCRPTDCRLSRRRVRSFVVAVVLRYCLADAASSLCLASNVCVYSTLVDGHELFQDCILCQEEGERARVICVVPDFKIYRTTVSNRSQQTWTVQTRDLR